MTENQAVGGPDDKPSERHLIAEILQNNSHDHLQKLKSFIGVLSLNEPVRWKLEMVLAIKENQPFQVFRIAGSHIFTGDDAGIVEVLLGCAVELMEFGGLMNTESSVSFIYSPPSTASVFLEPKPPILSIFARNTLRKHMKNNHGLIEEHEIDQFARRFKVPLEVVEDFCEKQKEKMERAAAKLLEKERQTQTKLPEEPMVLDITGFMF